jgi:hypothetical protein
MSHILLEKLALPSDVRIDQRVPKKMLLEHGAPTAADRRLIQDGISELLWAAALKPNNIGVPAYRDKQREYLEIAVLAASVRPKAKMARLQELVHRAVPYPVVLLTSQGESLTISLAQKRWSQGEGGKIVLDSDVVACDLQVELCILTPGVIETAFLDSLSLAQQPSLHLMQLYQGWIDRVEALQAARISGTFHLHRPHLGPPPLGEEDKGQERRRAIHDYARLQREIGTLRAQATKQKQFNRRVELNLHIQQLETKLHEAKQKLS